MSDTLLRFPDIFGLCWRRQNLVSLHRYSFTIFKLTVSSSECGTWFAFESGKRVRVEEVEDSEQEIESSNGSEKGRYDSRVSKRRKIKPQIPREGTNQDDFEVFKNIRLGRFDLSKPSNEQPSSEKRLVISQPAEEVDNGDSPFNSRSWWICCQCENANNPDLTVGVCCVCSHRKGTCCSALNFILTL